MLPRYSCRRSISAAANHEFAGRLGWRFAARLRLRTLLPHDDAVAVLLDLPDSEWIQSRSAHRLPGAQIEAGVMPGAADALADHQTLGQRPMIMAAMLVDGEDVRPRAHQQNVFVTDMAEQGLSSEFGQLVAQY